ncbi:MAG: hypothetical protein V4773_27810 [Verrucomicrobiota bacterium]
MAFFAGNIAPAPFRRAFFFLSLAALTTGGALRAATPPVKPPDLSQAGKADPVEAARLLQQFRQSGIPDEYYLEFELRALPRRGEEQVFKGRLWGGRNTVGAITRIELTDAANGKHRLLLQNGERGGVWKFVEGKVVALGVAELFQPLLPAVEVTAFDVQMPFLYWPDASLEKLTRLYGRPTNSFFFKAPAGFSAPQVEVVAARGYLDTQYNAMRQTELLGKDNRVLKTFSLLSFKTVDGQLMPKSADYRNEVTRDKTRFAVTAAAVKLKLAPAVFDPATLVRDAELPARAKIVPLD